MAGLGSVNVPSGAFATETRLTVSPLADSAVARAQALTLALALALTLTLTLTPTLTLTRRPLAGLTGSARSSRPRWCSLTHPSPNSPAPEP